MQKTKPASFEACLTDVHPGVREAAHDALEAIDAGG